MVVITKELLDTVSDIRVQIIEIMGLVERWSAPQKTGIHDHIPYDLYDAIIANFQEWRCSMNHINTYAMLPHSGHRLLGQLDEILGDEAKNYNPGSRICIKTIRDNVTIADYLMSELKGMIHEIDECIMDMKTFLDRWG